MSQPKRPDEATALDPAELAELRSSIQELRTHLRTRFGVQSAEGEEDGGPEGEEQAGEPERSETGLRIGGVDPLELFDQLRRRISFIGSELRSGEVDEFGLDPVYLDRARSLLDFLYERWWRIEVSGTEHIPAEPRVLYVANRSGVLPYDGLMIAQAVEREGPTRDRPRFTVADWLATLPFSQPVLARLGGVRACPENVQGLLDRGHGVVVFPEGQKGALKLFKDRYRLQRFGRGGFVSLALRQQVAIVPVAVVGAEEAHPVLLRPALLQRLIGVPLPVTPTFPLLGPLGLLPLPTQWRIRFGEPVRFSDVSTDQADDPLYVNRTREQIRSSIQDLLEQELRRRSSLWS
jgi:1-acyl-sn-glycerol-3-phosphate acyltransferase